MGKKNKDILGEEIPKKMSSAQKKKVELILK